MQNTKFAPETLDPTMRKLLGCDGGNHEWVNRDGKSFCKYCGETRLFTSSTIGGMGTWSPQAQSTASWGTASGFETTFSSGI